MAKKKTKPKKRALNPDRPLSPQQMAFCEAYAAGDATGKDSAIEAGYAQKYADSTASRLIKDCRVEKVVSALREKAAKKAEVKAEQVVREWARLGLSDIRKILTVESTGVTVVDSEYWGDDAAAAVASVTEKVKTHRGRDGNESREVTVTVKLHPKMPALNSLGKYLGILVEAHAHTGKDGGPIQTESKGIGSTTAAKIEEVLGIVLSNKAGE